MDHLGLNHPSVSVRGTEKGKVLEYYQGSSEHSSTDIIFSSPVSV